MAWTWWILASAVFLAFYDLSKKASVRANAVLPVLLGSTLAGSLAFLSVVALRGEAPAMLGAGADVIVHAAVKATIVATSWILTFCALRTLPVTVATPIRASAPALVFVAAFFFYGEVPTCVQGIGMLAVFGGYWAFSWAGSHEGIDFLRNRAVWCAVGGAVCSAVSSLWDKYLFQVRALPVEATQFWFQIFLVMVYAVLLAGRAALHLPRSRFEWRWTIPCTGILLAAADWLYFTGISEPGVPISVAALARRFSVVLTFVLGARMFHETNLRRKTLALTLVVIGIVLLCL